MSLPLHIASSLALHPLTTLELGGAARFATEAGSEADVVEALRWASARKMPVLVLGGGSNVVVADAGFDGLVIRMRERGVIWKKDGNRMRASVHAGEPWDDFVAAAVARNLAGVECLSGIPGLTGATPIQNVGAYGQDVSGTIQSVRVVDRATFDLTELDAAACGFAYRDSTLKRAPDQYVVVGVTFELTAGGPPALRYPELTDALATLGRARPTLADVRHTVLALRRKKSMVLEPGDPNRRSVGSFFTNPVVPAATAGRLVQTALARGLAKEASEVPQFPAPDGRVKLAAGWLIEHAGISKGFRRGAVGVSDRHALALVHHGGGSTTELLDLARHVRDAVEARFGITLVPEPTVVGTKL